jgi:hypothetical protein
MQSETRQTPVRNWRPPAVGGLSLGVLLLLSAAASRAQEVEYVPEAGKFPPPGVGVYLSGELVSVDHVNRRGAIRLVGDNNDDRYHWAPSHRFALLPYGTVSYHGAPAELRDVPIGTVLHGLFVLPPAGDQSVPPPDKNATRYVPRQTHAISLEDDFSYYQRQGQSWNVVSIDLPQGKLKLASAGKAVSNGLSGEQTFEIDASTRVWQGKQVGDVKQILAGQVVQINLTWAPDWKNGQFHVAEIWLDQESRDVATEVQKRIHVRHQRHRWLAGWIDHVEHQPGGKGIVTLTLFGGMDPSLYDIAKAQAKGGGAAIAAAEPTLRSWWQEHDHKYGPVLDVKEIPNPPTGSSGLQFRVQIQELLEGYRPGRIIRFRPNGFPNVKLPPEERVKSLEDR